MSEKLIYLRQRLLDTGKRNRLLNFKETKRSTLKITYPTSSELFSQILSNKTLKFPVESSSEDETIFCDQIDGYKTKDSVLSPKPINELNKTLYQLKQKSKTAFEELGVNILYLAFGFLEWKEVDFSEEVIKSPLILLPVEILRESIISPYTISLFDDDIVINPTLLYKLENDFGIKINLNMDFDDFQLNELLTLISSQLIKKSWVVHDDVQLSLFSFLKINMFKDLEINESLVLDNSIIKAIFGDPSELQKIPEEIPDRSNLDNLIIPTETYQVVDADASQQQAILAAKKGISFVLQGPPGTGKSQTITNIISECLSQGKKILFVSEKMAALEVVNRNLQRVGLDDFCLQLHSHKANKVQIIKMLTDTLNKPKTHANDNLYEALESLTKDKVLLNQYVTALHKKREPLGKSIYQIHGEIAKLHNFQNIHFKFNDINEITPTSVSVLREIVNDYVNCLLKIGGNYQDHPFYGFFRSELTYEYQNEIVEHLIHFQDTLNNISQVVDEINSYFGFNCFNKISDLPRLVEFLTLISASPEYPSSWLYLDEIPEKLSLLHELQNIFLEVTRLENETSIIFTDEIFLIGDDEMYGRFINDYSSFFRLFNSTYKADLHQINNAKKVQNKKISYKIILRQLKINKQLQLFSQKIEWIESIIGNQLSDQYKGRNSNWNYFYSSLDWIIRFREKFNINDIGDLCAKKICLQESNIYAQVAMQNIYNNHEKLKTHLRFNYSIFNYKEYDIKNEFLTDAILKIKYQIQCIEKLSDWIDYRVAKNICMNTGLQDFLMEIEKKQIVPDEYVGTLLKRVYLLWIDDIYRIENSLATFSKDRFHNLVNHFKEKDISQFSIAQARIRQLLSSQRPDNTGFATRGTEIHTLLRESEKRRKILPIRKLFEKIPNLILTLKPCLLMSPLSVSLFLDPTLYQFDVVIFDEASQVSTENAIGAIYRGKQLIMVGDREQLPPTNFFTANTSDSEFNEGDDEEEFGSYESILDECGGTLHTISLLWHYRSRHEHLITYSNAKIYKNLITFPTPISSGKDIGVEFVHVPDGVYLRSNLHSNVIEAKKVAELVFDHFLKYPNRSLGVVTFSEKQMEAIDNEINSLRKLAPNYEPYFDESVIEPFFIKNLENVQGDERDTIIFSIGYGKDQFGKISMNFGPLNREGGYRRLNVAITRAKYNVKLVSSILPLDLNRTDSQGVKMLRGYMEFAIYGPDTIKEDLTIPEILQFESPFEMDVYDVLVNNGYNVGTQVGCSGYRIDLSVKHPKLLDRYVLAIECDGATYHSAKTARERDRLREDVLRDRGWKFYRIWSTDWIRQRTTAIENLLEAVENSIKSYADELENNLRFSQVPKIITTKKILEEVILNNNDEKLFIEYKSYDKHSIAYNKYGSVNNFLVDLITFIVNSESPIHIEMIYQYVAPYLERKKITCTVISITNNVINNYCKGKFVMVNNFLWSNTMLIPEFRIPSKYSEPRDIKFIAKEELAEGMKIIINNSIGIEKYVLFQEVAKVLGFSRIGDNIHVYLEQAFKYMENKNYIETKNNMISLK
jgi:very-short-patch-repair endonuclease